MFHKERAVDTIPRPKPAASLTMLAWLLQRHQLPE